MWWVCLVLMLTLSVSNGASIHDARRLQSYLFSNYTPEHRPLNNQSETVKVSAIVNLLDITDFDDVKQQFICNALFTIDWKDEFLVWDPEDFGGIKYFTFNNGYKAWFPSITVTNTLEKRDIFKGDTQRMTVFSNGTVLWLPSAILKTSCPLNVRTFPFDVQECSIYLMAVHYKVKEVEFVTGSDNVHVDRFQRSDQWELLDTSLSSIRTGNVDKWLITLRFQRRSLFYVLNVLIPIVILSILNMAVFAVPVESGEKLSFAVTVLLSLVVFMTFASELIPKTSTGMAMLTVYLTTVTASSAINVMLTIVVLVFHNKPKPNEEEIPRCLQKLVSLALKVSCRKIYPFDMTFKESSLDWKDVADALEYFCLRVFLFILVIYTFSFFVALTVF
ncbi:neuronal acetylcholine receptor subunit alpha-7-like [Haliotis rubra]|uniref:neuronal acetylcholine receptor subunit alpha-7-like n=1 Tax=Haliotis rubra TaxID=36100 RepID=UPI001EE50CBD|nr:neuronal acetylcholine receptor subunit alpha-7-like [Haliotis rubra]